MFCSRCGTKLDDTARICSHCGLDLVPTTPVKAIASGEVTEADIVREALSADFEILEELGRGGMAIVYRARDRQLDRDVAIKVLPFSLAFDAEFVERFMREARTSAQLEHPNIIPIFRVGKAGRVTFFVMKYLRGQSLSHLLVQRGKLTPPEIRRLLIESGSALGYAARRGVVHRDIKPDNIMFDEHGVCMVADFGIAKAVASGQKLTGTGMSIGTPHYMSPEQARAQNTDGRSDIYSLGVLAYQCLIGSVPYDGDDSFSIGYKHIMEPLPEPQLDTPDERRLFEVIKKMLAKDPAERFQTCDELVAGLEGQAIAPGGTVRGSGVSNHVGASLSAPDAGASLRAPGMVTPVAPAPRISSSTIPMRGSVAGGRRPIARRSETESNSAKMGMLALLLLVAAGGGAWWFFGSRNDNKSPTAVTGTADSASSITDSSQVALNSADTTMPAAGTDSTPVVVTDSPAVHTATLDSSQVTAGAPSTDSGEIRLTGLPRGTRVMIDGNPVISSPIRVPPGRHILAISAPRYQFFQDTLDLQPGASLEMAPSLAPLGAAATPTVPLRVQQRRTQRAATPGCDEPVVGYNADRICYDQRPRPVIAPFVALTPEVEGTPRPSVLLVKVSTEGKTLEVRQFNPSNDAAFEKLARAYATAMSWLPAIKGGTAVVGWTQMAFPPQQQ
ncbi:MAG: protein kinase [Gemmatimonadota bacterium]